MSRRFGRNQRVKIGAWVFSMLAIALSGCVKRDEVLAAEARQERLSKSPFEPSYVTDPETGCMYLHYDGGTYTPRIAADGHSHMGCKGAKP